METGRGLCRGAPDRDTPDSEHGLVEHPALRGPGVPDLVQPGGPGCGASGGHPQLHRCQLLSRYGFLREYLCGPVLGGEAPRSGGAGRVAGDSLRPGRRRVYVCPHSVRRSVLRLGRPRSGDPAAGSGLFQDRVPGRAGHRGCCGFGLFQRAGEDGDRDVGELRGHGFEHPARLCLDIRELGIPRDGHPGCGLGDRGGALHYDVPVHGADAALRPSQAVQYPQWVAGSVCPTGSSSCWTSWRSPCL